MSSVAIRRSIRWLPDPASEPTDTIVLTGKSGIFLDIRFFKDSDAIDWAFAGYRAEVSESVVEFKHHIDSRTLEPLSVVDRGTNSPLEDNVTLEIGEMVNPQTGQMTSYEEIWEEKELRHPSGFDIFIRNISGTTWHAQVDGWQMALGRDNKGKFWAWQAVRKITSEDDSVDSRNHWEIFHSNVGEHTVVLLPGDSRGWIEGSQVDWNGTAWIVLDKGVFEAYERPDLGLASAACYTV